MRRSKQSIHSKAPICQELGIALVDGLGEKFNPAVVLNKKED